MTTIQKEGNHCLGRTLDLVMWNAVVLLFMMTLARLPVLNKRSTIIHLF